MLILLYHNKSSRGSDRTICQLLKNDIVTFEKKPKAKKIAQTPKIKKEKKNDDKGNA